MRVLIVYNSDKSLGLEIARETSEILKNAGAKTELLEFEKAAYPANINDITSYFLTFNAVVAIGGDGTIIKIAKTAAFSNLPVIGINAGRLGYLASIDRDRLDRIKNIVSGEYTVEKRMMLTAEKYENGQCVDVCECLNDIVISKSSVATMLDIEVTVENDTIKYRADGLIAATPTGSTAYSLSAGGPVVDPSVDCMVLTAVCPHTLMNRSVIVGAGTSVSVKVTNTDDHKIVLSADGRAAFEIDDGSFVKVSRSSKCAHFIKLNNLSVYKIFSEKTKLD